MGFCSGTSWLGLRSLAWDCQLFRFLFQNFCVCVLRAGVCMEVRGQLLQVSSLLVRGLGIKIRSSSSYSKWLYPLSHLTGPSDTSQQLLCSVFHSTYSPELGQDLSGVRVIQHVCDIYIHGSPASPWPDRALSRSARIRHRQKSAMLGREVFLLTPFPPSLQSMC